MPRPMRTSAAAPAASQRNETGIMVRFRGGVGCAGAAGLPAASKAACDWSRRRVRNAGSGGGASFSAAAKSAASCSSVGRLSGSFMAGLRVGRAVAGEPEEGLAEGLPGARQLRPHRGFRTVLPVGDQLDRDAVEV